MAVGSTKVVQVTNIAPQATKDQMHVLFGYLGKIEDIRLYPTIRDVSCPVTSRICYIKFIDATTVGIAQHMTNTVFIDRALIVIPVQNGEIPDEYYALEMTRNGTVVPGFNVNEPKLPMHVINTVQGSGTEQVILTTDPQLETNSLPNYPPLPASYDSAKVEETRRTILVMNVDPLITPTDLIAFFTQAGEVKYLRSCTSNVENSLHYLVEFTEQTSIVNALKLSGTELKGSLIEIQHATQPIIKPQAKSNEAAQREIEEAMSRFKEAQNMINASIEPVIGMLTKDKRSSRRSRSRSRERSRRGRRSRSRSRSRRSRSRRRRSSSRSRRSRTRERKRRSKSRSKKRSRSRSKRRSGSRGSKTRRSRSKSRSRKRSRSRDRKSSRARSRDKDRKSRDRSRDRKRSRDRDRKSRERSKTKEKGRESKDRKSQSVDIEKVRTRSKSRSRSRRRSKSKDRRKERKRSRSRGSRRRSPTPKTSRRRSRTKSRDRKRDRKDKPKDRRERSRSRSKDRKERSVRSRDRNRDKDRSRSKSKTKLPSKTYDNEKANSSGVDTDKERDREKPRDDPDEQFDKDSGEKSDNMDISNSP